MNYLKLFAICALSAAAMTACDPKDETVPVTSVEITSTPSPLTLTVGGTTGRVSTRILPADATDKTITWSVVPEGVVTVAADGTVTAVASGSATITGTAANGKTDTCDVTVVVPESQVYIYTGTFYVSPGTEFEYTHENATISISVAADEKTADIVMFTPKFTATNMPPDMDITIPGIIVAKSAEGYSLSGETIVPTAVMRGTDLGEVPLYTMTDFSGTASAETISFHTKCRTETPIYDLTFEGTVTAE